MLAAYRIIIRVVTVHDVNKDGIPINETTYGSHAVSAKIGLLKWTEGESGGSTHNRDMPPL